MSDGININGNHWPCRFGFRALKNFQLETGKELSDLANISFADVSVLAKHGINSGLRAIGQEALDQDAIDDLLDSDPKAFGNIMKKIQADFALLFPEEEKSEDQVNEMGEIQKV